MILFMGCEVVFYKLECQCYPYHHMLESDFKRINLRKLCEKAILIICILTLDNSNTPLAKRY